MTDTNKHEPSEKISNVYLTSSPSLSRYAQENVDLNGSWDKYGTNGAEVRHVGDILNNQWELVRFIYHGSLGEIWEGRDVQNDLKVVVKFIPSDICYFQTELDNLRNLFRQLRGLDHPSINPVYFFGDDPKAGWYFVSGLRNGQKLVKWFHDAGEGNLPFTLEESFQIVESLAGALDYAFSQGIVHNDVNPATVTVERVPEGVKAYLTDFGLAASLRRSSMRISLDMTGVGGASPFMAPEQWRGRQLDGRADQYGLAATAYQLFSGRRPFVANSFDELRERILNTETESIANIPNNINSVLRKALAKNVDHRFNTCTEFAQALRDPRWKNMERSFSFVRAGWIAGILAVVLGLCGMIYCLFR